jgi:hypothetical protein
VTTNTNAGVLLPSSGFHLISLSVYACGKMRACVVSHDVSVSLSLSLTHFFFPMCIREITGERGWRLEKRRKDFSDWNECTLNLLTKRFYWRESLGREERRMEAQGTPPGPTGAERPDDNS